MAKIYILLDKFEVGFLETKINGHPREMEALSLEKNLLKTTNSPCEAYSGYTCILHQDH